MIKSFIFLLLIIFNLLINAHADEIFIESDELVITDDPLITVFVGNVYAYDKNIKLWSEEVSIFFSDDNNSIYQLKSSGKAKIVRENQEIISDQMIYHVIEEKIVAKGNIILIQNQDTIEGDELNVDLVKSKSIIKGSIKNRVKVKINNQ